MWWILACAAGTDPDVGADSGAARADPADDTGFSGDTSDTSADTSGGDGADSADSASGDTGRDTGDTAADPPPTTGPCVRYASAVKVAEVADPALDELSGLAVSRLNPGILWTHEDSGGAAELYALDASGATVATLRVLGAENVDWEDVAVGPCAAGWCLTIGDSGDPTGSRTDFAILQVEEPLLTGATTYEAPAEVWPYTYPDEPQDAEGLAVLPDGRPVVVTKRADATAGVYTLEPGATTLTWHADLVTGAAGEDLPARATAADLSTDGATLLVRTYLHLYAVDVTDLDLPGTPETLPFALELQGEAVAWDPLQGGFWQVAEGANPWLWYTGCAE